MKKLMLLTALLSTTAMSAHAGNLLFGGVTAGSADYGDNYGKETMYGVRVGTGILPIPLLNIEAGYMNFGEVDVNGVKAKTHTMYMAIKPTFSLIPKLDIYGRAGLQKWTMDPSGNYDSVNDTDFMYGVGVDYYLNDNFSIGLSYTHYELNHENIDVDLSGYELNAMYHFM